MSRRSQVAIYLGLALVMGVGVGVIGFDSAAAVPLLVFVAITAVASSLYRREVMHDPGRWDALGIAWFVIAVACWFAVSWAVRGDIR